MKTYWLKQKFLKRNDNLYSFYQYILSEIIYEKKNEIIQYEKPEIFFTEPDYSKQEEIILHEESKTIFTIDSQRNGLQDLSN